MKKISAYIWQFRGKYLIAVSALFAAVTLDMLSPRLTKMVVDDVIFFGLPVSSSAPMFIFVNLWLSRLSSSISSLSWNVVVA